MTAARDLLQQRSAVLARPSAMLQQVRFEGSDPRSSTSSEKHKSKPICRVVTGIVDTWKRAVWFRRSTIRSIAWKRSEQVQRRREEATIDDHRRYAATWYAALSMTSRSHASIRSGASRKDWSRPNQVTNNDPSYGKAGKATDMHNPDQGKN